MIKGSRPVVPDSISQVKRWMQFKRVFQEIMANGSVIGGVSFRRYIQSKIEIVNVHNKNRKYKTFSVLNSINLKGEKITKKQW